MNPESTASRLQAVRIQSTASRERVLPMAESSRAAGRDVTAVIYPEARHHFDGAEVRGIVFVPDARRNKGATIQYDPAAHEDSEKQILRFLRAHLGK